MTETAFQPDAFQNDAFQIVAIPVSVAVNQGLLLHPPKDALRPQPWQHWQRPDVIGVPLPIAVAGIMMAAAPRISGTAMVNDDELAIWLLEMVA